MKIKTRIILIILEIGLIPILLLGYLAYNNSYRRVEQITKANLATIVELQSARLEDLVRSSQQKLTSYTSNISIINSLQNQLQKPDASTLQQLNSSLLEMAKNSQDVKDILLFNLNGRVIASSNVSRVGETADKDNFQNWLAGNHVDNIEKEGASQQLTQSLAGPLKLDGKTIGVIKIETKPEGIESIAGDLMGLGHTGEILIVKDDGSGNAVFLTPTRFDPNAALNTKIDKNKYPDSPAIIMFKNKGKEGFFGKYIDYRGKEVFASTRYLKDINWGIVVKMDKSEFEAPFANIALATIMAVIGAEVVILLVGLSLGQFISGKILELQNKLLEEQAHAEAKLFSKWLNLNEAMLASIGDGVIVTDKEGKITYANKAVEEILGFNPKEIIQKPFEKVIERKDEKGQSQNAEYAKLTGDILSSKTTTTTTTTTFIKKDGSDLPVASVISPMELNGKIIGVVESFRDITREKRIDDAKTEFVSLAAHQLRTPLTSVNWYIEMLQDKKETKNLSKKQKAYLSEVYTASQRMVELIDAMLNVSRMELGTIKLNCQEVDFAEMAKKMIGQLLPEFKSKKIKLTQIYQKNMPTYLADPDLTNIIFQNLLTNALRYTFDKGQIHLSIHIKSKGDKFGGKKFNQKSYAIMVKDSGIGIPKDQQAKIFTKMYRADNAKSHEQNGNGLGLYLVKKIVQMYKGNIWFDSKQDAGTAFYVQIPLPKKTKKQLDQSKKNLA